VSNHAVVTEVNRLVEYITLLAVSLLITTAFAALEYYKRLRKAHKEYERARDAIEDIILSINREMRREAGKLETMEYKIAGISGKVDTALTRIDSIKDEKLPIETRLVSIEDNAAKAVATITQLTDRAGGLEKAVEFLDGRVKSFEKQFQRLPSNLESGDEPVIQLRRDKAIGPLTDTEISVLEMLSKEGAKTAPEIKETVKLSREHTARLMKKLYEGGYVDRETGKIPFRYNVKKEMEQLLPKPESEVK
jgi:chromosome segregation ATPase